jgi:hypothetical protein
MKNIFEINNNERNRILEMHINATKKLYLIEQENVTNTTETPQNIEERLKTKINPADTGRDFAPYGTGNKTSMSLDVAIQNSILERDARNWSLLKREMKTVPELVPFTSKLVNEFVDTWNNPENKGKKIDVTLTRTEKLNNEPPKYADVGFEVNWEPESNVQLYINNEWEVSDEFKRLFNEKVIAPVQQLRKVDPNLTISLMELSIETSASRYRNTGRASELTFSQLSGYRNNTAKDYIISILDENGVLNTKEITPTQKYLGSNGDGTSGPNPPEPNRYIDGGEVKMELQPTQPRNQFGEPHTTPEEYDQYKYLKVTIKLRATSRTPEVTDIDPTYDYSIKVGNKPSGGSSITINRRKTPSLKLIDKITTIFRITPEKCAAYN